ncbi:GNAT family N-acetyltransferase [Streptomyces sp. LN785]|uniref:GNAT family N-acetyltransferase n=1 Tax=Streptomyces sp. LN785 TaxID=3112983 RepID=UPI00371D4ECC
MADLSTPRLVLHPLSPAEAEDVAARSPGPGARWAPEYPTVGDTVGARNFLRHCAGTGDPRPFGAYEIRLRANGHAIGGAGFHGPPDAQGEVTIGYGLVPAVRGNGYASEALRALLNLARGEGVTVVRGDADLGNTASQHVMEAAGMRFSGEDERVKYFRIEWPAARGRAETTDTVGTAGAVQTADSAGSTDLPKTEDAA